MTADLTEDWMLKSTRKCCSFLTRGMITVEETVDRLFDQFAYDERMPVHLAPQVWALIPEVARIEFARRIEEALQEGFCRSPFLYGGGQPVTEEVLQRDAKVQTARVRAWAERFRQVIAEDTDRP